MNVLKPEIEGDLPIHSSNECFIASLRQRVETGLIAGHPGPRQDYEVIQFGQKTIGVRATSWITAINVGLNDLLLDFSESGTVSFQLRYWRWATYCIALCGILGFAGIAMFYAIDIRRYITNHPNARIPGLTIDQNVYLAWGNILFWGFIWPWILVATHKGQLKKLLARIFSEVDSNAIKVK